MSEAVKPTETKLKGAPGWEREKGATVRGLGYKNKQTLLKAAQMTDATLKLERLETFPLTNFKPESL